MQYYDCIFSFALSIMELAKRKKSKTA